jgi:16S rRNA (adenine1518-N6/adenine1519-N6)-dimethyltransferase
MAKLPWADKDLGQHYLKDKNIIEKITTNFESEADVIIEIGPGPAVLSRNLSKKGVPYYFVEKDDRFKEQLESITPIENQYFQDALKFNWFEFIKENDLVDKKIWLVSNLPYNVSSQLFISFLKIPAIKYMSLMFQKEVGEKTYIRENTKNQMGSLLSLSQNYFDSKKLILAHPGAFLPPPKVESVVVSYIRKENPIVSIEDFKSFEKFLRLCFSMKRKQLGSVLKTSIDKDKVATIFNESNIPSTVRAEALELADIYTLYREFGKVCD